MTTVYFDGLPYGYSGFNDGIELRKIGPIALETRNIGRFHRIASGPFTEIGYADNRGYGTHLFVVLAAFDDVARAKQIPFDDNTQFILSPLPKEFIADKQKAIAAISGGKQLPSKIMKEWEDGYDDVLRRSQEWREKLRAAVTIFDLRDPDLKNKLSPLVKPQAKSDETKPQGSESPVEAGVRPEVDAAHESDQVDSATAPTDPGSVGVRRRGRSRRATAG